MSRGQSLLEVVIAIGIFALGTGAVLTLLVNQLSTVQTNEQELRASLIATEALDATRHIRDRSWLEVASGTHGLAMTSDQWLFSGAEDIQGDFTRSVTVTDIDTATRDVVATVSWQAPNKQSRSLSVATRLTDWRSIGMPELSGDWRNPRTLGSVDLGPGVTANGIAVRNRVVFIAGSASSSSKPDFFVIDATNGNAPQVIGSINTGPGLNEVAVLGNYAYVANRDDDQNQLQIIAITNLNSPQLAASFTPPNTDDAEAFSVAVVGNTVYLGLEKSSGAEFRIIDVTNPLAPVQRGALELNASIYDIAVRGPYAYLATDHDDREIVIVDVAQQTNPTIAGQFDAPGGSENGQSIDVHDDVGTTYLARTVGGNHLTHHEFFILNTNNPQSPISLGSLNLTADVLAVRTVDYLAFLGTTDSNNEFKVYRIDSPGSITLWSAMNFPQVASDIAYERNTIYVAVRSNDALRIITSTP